MKESIRVPDGESGMSSGHSARAAEYAQLTARRKACRLCHDLTNPAQVDGGKHDVHGAIGPWTAWQGNLSAGVIVVGQDWGDVDYFRKYAGKDDPNNPTNKALLCLMKEAGLEIEMLEQRVAPGKAYFTNAILCLKSGGMQAPVLAEWFSNCSLFLVQQIKLVKPKVVVTLGQKALNAVLAAFGMPERALRQAVEVRKGIELFDECRLFAMYHCGARVLNTHRRMAEQRTDWQRLGKFLSRS